MGRFILISTACFSQTSPQSIYTSSQFLSVCFKVNMHSILQAFTVLLLEVKTVECKCWVHPVQQSFKGCLQWKLAICKQFWFNLSMYLIMKFPFSLCYVFVPPPNQKKTWLQILGVVLEEVEKCAFHAFCLACLKRVHWSSHGAMCLVIIQIDK